jgi:hypothetical protein
MPAKVTVPKTVRGRVRQALMQYQLVRTTSLDLKRKFNQDVDPLFFNDVYDTLMATQSIVNDYDKVVAARDMYAIKLNLISKTSALARFLGGKAE